MTPRQKLEDLAFAVFLAVAGVAVGVRLLYRAIDAGTTFPAEVRR